MLSFTAQGSQGTGNLLVALVTDSLDDFMPLYKQINNNPNFELYPEIHGRLLHTTKGPKIAAFLIEQGADVNAKDIGGNTPLMDASSGRFPLAKLLIEKGADVKAKNNAGETAYDIAERTHKITMQSLDEAESNVAKNVYKEMVDGSQQIMDLIKKITSVGGAAPAGQVEQKAVHSSSRAASSAASLSGYESDEEEDAMIDLMTALTGEPGGKPATKNVSDLSDSELQSLIVFIPLARARITENSLDTKKRFEATRDAEDKEEYELISAGLKDIAILQGKLKAEAERRTKKSAAEPVSEGPPGGPAFAPSVSEGAAPARVTQPTPAVRHTISYGSQPSGVPSAQPSSAPSRPSVAVQPAAPSIPSAPAPKKPAAGQPEQKAQAQWTMRNSQAANEINSGNPQPAAKLIEKYGLNTQTKNPEGKSISDLAATAQKKYPQKDWSVLKPWLGQ